VRLQGDNLAALLVPTSGLTVTEELRERARARLVDDTRAALPEDAEPLDFTLALLELTIEQPSHWQVLGPLVWAELERAYTLERRGPGEGLQSRRLQLGGFVPGRDEG
ncbi:MAG TPA: GGDEF domain-containing protein, partial [Myxococcaceae bacterium]|nr:GGDEF domain-containing protein [Myxococcaceae bacterium]